MNALKKALHDFVSNITEDPVSELGGWLLTIAVVYMIVKLISSI